MVVSRPQDSRRDAKSSAAMGGGRNERSRAVADNNAPNPRMALDGMRVVVLVADGVEDLEYWVTVMRLREEGAAVLSVGLSLDRITGKNGLTARADRVAEDVDHDAFDGLVIPGGWAPDKLRRYPAVTNLVRAVHDAAKPIGIICHGGLVAISAGIVGQDRPATGSLGIRDDLVNAGARWVDESAFRDGQLVWGRVVEDIPEFERELVALFAEHHRRDRVPA
jgi:deglycase